MIKRLSVVLLILLLIISLVGCNKATEETMIGEDVETSEVVEETEDISLIPISERKLLRVGTPGQHYPWNFYEAGELKGADIETLEEACRRIGYDVEFKIIAFEGLYGSIDAGTTDTGA